VIQEGHLRSTRVVSRTFTNTQASSVSPVDGTTEKVTRLTEEATSAAATEIWAMALSVRADVLVLTLEEPLAAAGAEGKNRAAGQVVVPFVAAGADRAAGRKRVRASEADMSKLASGERKELVAFGGKEGEGERARRTVTTGREQNREKAQAEKLSEGGAATSQSAAPLLSEHVTLRSSEKKLRPTEASTFGSGSRLAVGA
jgi:hypothetical protein